MKKSIQLFSILLILTLIVPSFAFGQDIFGGFDDSGGNTFVHLSGPGIPITPPATVTVGGNPLSGVSHFEEPVSSGQFVIEGTIFQPIANFPAGNYDVIIDGVTFSNVFLDAGPPPATGNPQISVLPSSGEFGNVQLGGISDFFFDIQNNGDADLNVTSIIASGGPFTIITPLPGPIPGFGGFINVHVQFAPTVIGDANGQVDIQSNAGPITVPLHGFGEDTSTPPPTTGPQIFGGSFIDEGGVTQVEIFGSQLPTDLTNVTVGSHVVTGITVVPDDQSPNADDFIIKGAVSALISTIQPGNFDVTIISPSLGTLPFPQLFFEVHTGPPPTGGGIFGSFKDDGAGGISVHIGGQDIPNTLPGNVTVGGNPVTNISHFEDLPDFPGEFIIEGTIALPIASFPEGPHDVVIDALSFPGVFFGLETGPPPPAGPDLLIDTEILTFGSPTPILTGNSEE